MKKLWKRLGALMMTLAMVLSLGLGITAFAADPTADITLKNVAAGDIAKAYRLVAYNTGYTDYVFADDGFKAFVKAKYSTTDDAVAMEAFKALNSEDVSDLLKEYETKLQAGTATLTNKAAPAYSESASGTPAASATFTGVTPGYYLVRVSTTATNSYVYTPVSIFVRRVNDTNIEVYAGASATPLSSPYEVEMKKKHAPSLIKHVKDQGDASTSYAATNTAAVGDTVSFRVAVTIPDYTDSTVNLTDMVLVDTLTNLEYVDSSAKVCSDAECTTEVAGALTDASASGSTLTIKLNASTIGNDTTVYVYYEAKVLPTAANDDKSINAVKMTYKNTVEPTVNRETGTDKTTTFSFAVNLEKYNENGSVPLNGAVFKVYKDDGAGNPGTLMAFMNAGTYYYPVATGTTGAVNKLDTDTGSTFLIKGLDVGTYFLEEITPPEYYYAPNGMFKIVLAANDAGILQTDSSSFTAVNPLDNVLANITPTVSASNSGHSTDGDQYNVGLKNSLTPALPATGGMGTTLFTVLGVALMALAAYLFFFRRKKNA